MKSVAPVALSLALITFGCASALKTPAPLSVLAALPHDASIDQILEAARERVRRCDDEADAKQRERLAVDAVQLAQHCRARDPQSAGCDYWLGIALGLQAREKPTTANDGLDQMLASLRRAIERDPGYDHAGPHRVLALVLLRAPGWPAGPGDVEAGEIEARSAVQLDPTYPPNLLAMAEALQKNGHRDESRSLIDEVRQRLDALDPTTEPEVARWRRDLATLDR
ncbi:MAG: hypothetical protein U0V87_18520 [Acidobacteriota bacterium]